MLLTRLPLSSRHRRFAMRGRALVPRYAHSVPNRVHRWYPETHTQYQRVCIGCTDRKYGRRMHRQYGLRVRRS
eukprot:3927118-Rhodomonas_salina.3